MSGSLIRSVKARQIISARGHPGLEATVITEDGTAGIAVATAGVSVGAHEVSFRYDGGDRWDGRGLSDAVALVNNVISSALHGVDASRQRQVDSILCELDGTPNKTKLGGNVTASVSAAVLKVGAASLNIPLYQHIGGVNALTLPTPGVETVVGSSRYGGGERSGGKPSYSFMAHGFPTFSEASYACWRLRKTFQGLLERRYKLTFISTDFLCVPAGIVTSDRELWDCMAEAIELLGYAGRVGIQVDVAAGTYYDAESDAFVGLFSREEKSRNDLISLYRRMVQDYPFVMLEDPLDETDYPGHALLTKQLGIAIVGDDLFTTNKHRLQAGIDAGACNTMLLKVNQVGTISEAFDVVDLAYRSHYAVMPCGSRGEGPDIADYAVGLNTGSIRESGFDSTTNRLLAIEAELGRDGVFLGRAGFPGK
jgi:enolase